MQNNVRQVRASDTLKEAAYELLDARSISGPSSTGTRRVGQADGARGTEGEYAARAGGDRGDDRMSRRMDVAKAYEKALFAGTERKQGATSPMTSSIGWPALPGSRRMARPRGGARCLWNASPAWAPPTGDTRRLARLDEAEEQVIVEVRGARG